MQLQGAVGGSLAAKRAAGVQAPGVPIERSVLLLSTDSVRAYSERGAIARYVGTQTALGFGFERTKYSQDASRFIEDRMASSNVHNHRRQLLVESLLDLGLLAQADVLIGSIYSNFARVAMGLGGTRAYASFDAKWCPYHLCQAGCSDIERLCWKPRALAFAELDYGTQLFGRAARPPTTDVELYLAAPPARRAWVKAMRAWVKAMIQLRALPHRHARNACTALFHREADALAAMPPIY